MSGCRCDKDDNGTWHGKCTCVNFPQMSDARLLELAEQEDGCQVSVWSNWSLKDEEVVLKDLLLQQSRRMDKMEKALRAFADPDNWFDCYAGAYAMNFTPYPGWRGPMEDNPGKFAQEALDYDGAPINEEDSKTENS